MTCDFCGAELKKDFAIGSQLRDVSICKTCVTEIYNAMKYEENNDEDFDLPFDTDIDNIKIGEPEADSLEDMPSISDIKDALDAEVIGQESAKRVLSVAVANHYRRIKKGKKSNILMIGPTGCGKTLMVKTIADILDVPYTIVDCSNLTQSGYRGGDVDDILNQLYIAAGNDRDRAETGIVFLDEIDKIASTGCSGPDVGGLGVQQGLLKIIEGAEITFADNAHHRATKTINTEKILFICSGAFPGIHEDRSNHKKMRTVGFCRDEEKYAEKSEEKRKITAEDIIRYGFIPEFVGRLPVIVELDELVVDDLKNILKRFVIPEFNELFNDYGVRLSFSCAAIDKIVTTAIENNTGARGLRGIVENTLQEPMYRIGVEDHVSSVTINEELEPEYLNSLPISTWT